MYYYDDYVKSTVKKEKGTEILWVFLFLFFY